MTMPSATATLPAAGAMSRLVRVQLSAMMFLQSFVWGAWYVTAPNYLGNLGFTATDFGWTYSVGPIAGMVSPIIVGMIADRYVAAERVLGVVNLFSAGVMLLATILMRSNLPSPVAINLMFFVYMLAFYPTFALLATLTMKNLANPEKDYPGVRVFGTIGWIAAGFVLTWSGWEKTIDMFYLSAASGVLMGLYSFTLPHTPAVRQDKVTLGQALGAEAFVLFKDRSYLIFMLCSTLICIPLAFYQQIASRVVEMVDLPIGQTMAYGQISEIVFMLIMPLFFFRLGVKWMLAAGMAAWVLRYLMLAIGAPHEISWLILGGIVLHGICQDFFFVTGQIYTDQLAPKAIRGQAQGMLVIFTLGLGMTIGAQLGGRIEAHYTPKASTELGMQVAEHGRQIAALEAADAPGSASIARIDTLRREKMALRKAELEAKDWTMIFAIPAAFAMLVLLLFVALFRDSRLTTRKAIGLPDYPLT